VFLALDIPNVQATLLQLFSLYLDDSLNLQVWSFRPKTDFSLLIT